MQDQMMAFASVLVYGLAGFLGGLVRLLNRTTPFTWRGLLSDMASCYLMAVVAASVMAPFMPEHNECMGLWGVASLGGILGYDTVRHMVLRYLRKKLGER